MDALSSLLPRSLVAPLAIESLDGVVPRGLPAGVIESGTFFVSPIAVPAIEMQKKMSIHTNKFADTHLLSHLLSVPRVGLEPTQPFRAKGF